jgi:uncharacterized membrane protein
MKARLRYTAALLRDSYWFTPGLIMLGTVVLSVLMPAADRRWGIDALREAPALYSWIYTGGPDGAGQVLAVIASSMITVAGVVFSITIVALSLASSQFGPRVLASFMADRGNQIVLGTFVGTFLYSLLILRTIRGDGAAGESMVPHLSVTAAVLLAIASLCVLIYFIHHVSISIQAPHLVAVISAELHHSIATLPVKDRTAPVEAAAKEGMEALGTGDEEGAMVAAPQTGYIEAIDYEGLMEMASRLDLRVRLDGRPGHYVIEGRPLAYVWPADAVDERLARRMGRLAAIGSHRTAVQDMEFPVEQLVEVAVRALSPSINDPFTAMNCIDQLSSGLVDLARKELPPSRLADGEGEVRVLITRPVTFEGVVRAAFEQIRQNAAHHASVHMRMLESLGIVIGAVHSPARLEPLLNQARLAHQAAAENVPAAADRADIERRYAEVLEIARQRRATLEPAPR